MATLYFSTDTKSSNALRNRYRNGELYRIHAGIYIDSADKAEINKTLNNNWQKIARHIYKDSIAVFRTAVELRPVDGRIYLMDGNVNQDRKLTVGPLKFIVAPGNVKDGVQHFHIDIESSNRTRQLLENLSRARISDGIKKTLGNDWVEDELVNEARRNGEQSLNTIRDEARELAPVLGLDKEFDTLNKMISAVLSTHSAKGILKTGVGIAYAAGKPIDVERLARLEKLASYLYRVNLTTEPYGYNKIAWKNLTFFESYFSNYIEGTEFTLDEAEKIIESENGVYERHEDSHDILSHINISGDYSEMHNVPTSPEELIEILEVRHSILLAQREDKKPGQFKEAVNRAGNTVFVEPDRVKGTLIKGFDIYKNIPEGIKRAFFIHFLIAEIHPFNDGNGRMARIMMNAELVSNDLFKIIVPTVCRDNYLNGMRQATRYDKFRAITKILHQLHQFTASVDWEDYNDARQYLEGNKADNEPDTGMMTFNKLLRNLKGDYQAD